MQSLDKKMEDTTDEYRISLKISIRNSKGEYEIDDDDCNINNLKLFSDWHEDYTLENIKDKILSLNTEDKIHLIRRRYKRYQSRRRFEDKLRNKTGIDDDTWTLISNRIMGRNGDLMAEYWEGRVRYQIVIYRAPFPQKTSINTLFVAELEYKIYKGWGWNNQTSVFDKARIYYCSFYLWNDNLNDNLNDSFLLNTPQESSSGDLLYIESE